MLIALRNIPPFNNQASTGDLEKAKVESELGTVGKKNRSRSKRRKRTRRQKEELEYCAPLTHIFETI